MKEFGLAGTRLNRHFHVCGFFNSREEQYDVLASFYREAIDRNEKLVTIVDPERCADHLRQLDYYGILAPECQACGQLEVLGWDDAYLRDGSFDQARMLDTIDEVFASGRRAGYGDIRITGEMGWALKGHPGSDQLIEYEARVNTVLARNRQPAVCIYDAAQLSGSLMMDILRAHPLTLVGGVVHENPFYTEPEALLRDLETRRKASHARGDADFMN